MKPNRDPIVFDIETGGYEAEKQIAMFEPQFKPDNRLKDPAKIKADRLEKQGEWLEKATLDASRSVVLAIGIKAGTAPATILSGEEADIVGRFWDVWAAHSVHFIGFNIKNFDIPFLIRRSYVLGIKVPLDVMEGRYLSRKFVDLMEMWAAGEWGAKISLDNLSRALGVGKKNGSGKDFAKLLADDPVKAVEYLTHDLELTQGCAKKMGAICG